MSESVQSAGRFGDRCESAGVAIYFAPAFDIAAFRNGAIRIDINQDVIMAAPAIVNHCPESARRIQNGQTRFF